MWIVSTRGFFSTVAHRDRPGLVLVRSRAREDLVSLGELIGPLEITHTPQRDYAFRAEVPRKQWSAALVLLASEIDYPNFKDVVAERQGQDRAGIYHRVWSDLAELQR